MATRDTSHKRRPDSTRRAYVDDAQRDATARRIGDAVKRARSETGISQPELGRRLGGISQGTISSWENGRWDLSARQIAELEAALELPHGHLFALAGLAPTAVTPDSVETMLEADPALHPDLRSEAIRLYRVLVALSERLASADGRGSASR